MLVLKLKKLKCNLEKQQKHERFWCPPQPLLLLEGKRYHFKEEKICSSQVDPLFPLSSFPLKSNVIYFRLEIFLDRLVTHYRVVQYITIQTTCTLQHHNVSVYWIAVVTTRSKVHFKTRNSWGVFNKHIQTITYDRSSRRT